MYSATYSPDDNKLRLYASTRLDPETYKRVKAAGFKWAPQQGLFVAPMWTPDRENLLIELAGEIEDEDKSLVDRAEERADRFTDYKHKRAADAESARQAVSRIADNIPLGQPILVGHHSERHARRDAERIENGMRRAVKMWRTSEYWASRAAGALHHAKYKERPDVRARRIKGLEADKRKQEKHEREARTRIGAWRRVARPSMPMPKQFTAEDTLQNRALFIANYFSTGYGGTWSELTDRKITPREAMLRELKTNARYIAWAKRWTEHYDNRLTYERAMLADAGGTASDKTGPEAGGACKCWASLRGGWSYIQKVNKVSVTVLDNWGNGGANFTRTIPFDKLSAVMTKADVDAKREAGLLVEDEDKTGFFLLDAPRPKPTKPQSEPEQAAAAFNAMADTLRNGGVQVVTAPNLFPTPADVARQVHQLADVRPGMRVLEPSAGTGSLLENLPTQGQNIIAVEINMTLANRLRGKFKSVTTWARDFLELTVTDLGAFDRIVMNPPLDHGSDIQHINHARRFLRQGGKLVAICADGPRQREAFTPFAMSYEPLPKGSFASQGTDVNTAIVVFEAAD